MTVLAGHLEVPIVITRGTWQGHVVERHPEMGPYLELTIAALEAPDVIGRDSRYPERVYFWKKWPDVRDFPAAWLEVMVVLPTDGRFGRLLSAFPVRSVAGKEIIWTAAGQD